MTYRSRRYPRKQKKCWCGSGKKQKNCHPNSRAGLSPAERAESKHERTPSQVASLGVPGEEQKIWAIPVPSDNPEPKRGDLGGLPGKYKAQFLLSRPGYPVTQEREYKFIDDIVGSSHILIAKPLRERKADDPDRVYLGANAFNFFGFANEAGYLGKIVSAEFDAASAQDAESKAYGALAPFLSAWAVHLDIPVHVETIQITELRTSINSLRVRNPYLEMTFAAGVSPVLSDEFCVYASLYREGLNSNSGFYRFLCFYKVIESVFARRTRLDWEKKQSGQAIQRVHERLPDDVNGFKQFLSQTYPWRGAWDEMSLSQIFPREVWGQKVTNIRDKYLRPLRVGIAHAVLEKGEVRITVDRIDHIQQVNIWLPLCRIVARLMLKNEFPPEFALSMQPLPDTWFDQANSVPIPNK